jgi:molecular chaperone Hsp33
VAEVLETYMRNSEQLETRLWLASDSHQCVGLLLQRLPRQGGVLAEQNTSPNETWERATLLANTVTYEELLALDTDTLVHRLFWEEHLVAFQPQNVEWHCPCTRERVAKMLRMLGRAEIASILSEKEKVEVSCNFCGKPYEFDPIDCAGLFIDNPEAIHTRPNTMQ